MSYYTNTADQCFPLRERPLEPPDCWGPVEYGEAIHIKKMGEEEEA